MTLIVVLLACVMFVPAFSNPFVTQPWNIKGDTMVFDLGSLTFQGNHPMSTPLNEQGCADACLRTPGCNAWTFCNGKNGCGSGCKEYTSKNPTVPIGIDNPNPNWSRFPVVLGFGPFGWTSRCKEDAYPRGMCTLKTAAKPSAPEYWSKNAGEGWVSGVWNAPAECAGLAGRSCLQCQQSKNPQQCLKCAGHPAVKVSMLEGALANSPSKADGCSACYNLAKPDACVACLTSGAPCGTCAIEAINTMSSSFPRELDVASCIDCTKRMAGNYAAPCMNCASLGAQQPQQVSRCLMCLERMSKVACNSTEYQPGCWNPTLKPSACSTCAGRGSSYEACMACMLSKPFSDNCESCAGFSDHGKQAQCYKCSAAAAHPGSGCSDCLNFLTDAAHVQQCLGCLTNPKTMQEGKQWCFGCQNWCNDAKGRAQCVACLGTHQPKDSYMQSCACK